MRIKILLFISFLSTVSCVSQRTNDTYSNCMEKQMQGTGINFYKNIGNIEEKMIEIGGLKNRSKESYLNAFQSLIIDSDIKWKNYYNVLKESVLSDFNLETFKTQVLSFCSDIKPNSQKNLDCNCLNVHKFFLKKMVYKPYDDEEVLDGLLLFTNFDDDTLRYNITYLLLLNMNSKFEK